MKVPQGVYEESGYTKIRIWLGPKKNPDGSENRPYRRSMGLWSNETIQDAKNHVDLVREQFKTSQAIQPEPKPIGFPAVSHIYFDKHWKNKRGRSSDSIKNTEYLLIRLRRIWAARAWHSFNPSVIEEYIHLRKTEGAAPGTINRELAIISSMFTQMERWVDRREISPFLLPTTVRGLPFNPAELVEREPDAESKRERTASDEELAKVKNYCDEHDPDMLIMIERAIITGLRKTDLEKVNGVKDVRGILSKSKEKKLFRMPLDFTRRISYINYDRRWDALREACTMQDFHWHDWRHTSATLLSMLGFTDEQVREFLGQSDVRTTRDYINHKERFKPHVEGLRGHLKKVSEGVAPLPPKDLTKKVCLGCKQEKLLDGGFYRHSAFKSGLDSRCKTCRNEERDRRRASNPTLRSEEWARRKSRLQAIPA